MNELYHNSGENASGNCVERPGYYAVIPADVRYDTDLKPNAKLLYGEISALIGPEGYCYASNGYFAQLFSLTEETVSRLVSQLLGKGYILRSFEYGPGGDITRRRLYLRASAVDGRGIDEKINTPCAKNQEGIDEKVKENSLSNTVSSTRTRGRNQNHTLTDEQMAQAIRECAETMGNTNRWSGPELEAVCKLVHEFYGPRAVSGKPPMHTTRGVNGLFRKMSSIGPCSAQAAMDMLLTAIERGWTSVYPEKVRQGRPARMAPAAPARSVDLGVELT